jgi:hypothetical protein
MRIAESELIINDDGSAFHIHLKPEELADIVILVGDPGRVDMVSEYLTDIEFRHQSREFVSTTGKYNGKRVTVLSTGIGTDNIDIVMTELDALANVDFTTREPKKEHRTQEQKEQQLQTEDSYKEQLQQQLKELLEHMDGVGKTRVMLTFSDEGTDQLDKNVTKDGNKKEETTVVYDTGDTRQPYVICRQMPKIEGVVVVAQGGGNAKTVTEISNAVMSLFPVEAHKVVVVKMSVQEE